MILPPSLTSLHDNLLSESERLKEALGSVSPNLWTLVQTIKAVKKFLKKLEKELLKFMEEEEVANETKDEVENVVIEDISKAENYYSLDKLVFSLLENEHQILQECH